MPVGSALVLTAGYAWSKDDVRSGSDIKRDGLGIAALDYLSKRTSLNGGVNNSKLQVPDAPDGKTRVVAAAVRPRSTAQTPPPTDTQIPPGRTGEVLIGLVCFFK